MKEKFKVCIQCKGIKAEDTHKCCSPSCLRLCRKEHLAAQWAQSPYRARMHIQLNQANKFEADKNLARNRRDSMGLLIT